MSRDSQDFRGHIDIRKSVNLNETVKYTASAFKSFAELTEPPPPNQDNEQSESLALPYVMQTSTQNFYVKNQLVKFDGNKRSKLVRVRTRGPGFGPKPVTNAVLTHMIQNSPCQIQRKFNSRARNAA